MLDIRTCILCKKLNGTIRAIGEVWPCKPPLHPYCRCIIGRMQAIEVGTASDLGVEGPDYYLKNFNTLPPYYIKKREAEFLGWKNYLLNFPVVAPGKMLGGDIYKNKDGKLPSAPGRTWREADIDYTGGPRSGKRVLYSNDGLLFVSSTITIH